MRSPRLLPIIALCGAIAMASGCGSLQPREHDPAVVWLGKALVWVPASVAVVAVDGFVEDETTVSPVEVFAGERDGGRYEYDIEDVERAEWRTQRALAQRELAGRPR